MVRIFGLIVALAALMTPASAALLARYDFTGNADATTNFVTATTFGGTAGNAVGTTSNAGFAPDTGVWRTDIGLTAGEFNSFTLTAGAAPVTVDNILFSYRRQDGTGNPSGTITYKIGSNAEVLVDTFNSANSVNVFNAAGVFSFALNAGESVLFSINYDTNVNGLEIGFVEVQGSVVPEPASMAIFGTLAGFGLVRRLRRK
jgi:hypothetical protein